MRTFSTLGVILAATALSACVSATSAPSYEDTYQSYEPLARAVAELSETCDANGANCVPNNTLFANLPSSGPGKYSGLLLSKEHCSTGSSPSCSGPKVEYLAKLSLDVNFVDQTLTGSLSNFVTKLANFKNPTGTINLTGGICDNGTQGADACDGSAPDGLAYIVFEGGGELIGANGNVAFYWLKSGSPSGANLGADGALGGNSGQVMAGDFGSDFQWLAGTYIGTISGSDGEWVAMLQ